ncbi:hypothetical protein [Bradyrhizobium sp. 23]|uniref:hypothetical protein n=1 Tax=Bradyrhizobium sp. 23 TaxID=2782667 RepID=UPI001FFB04CF|nr:hypothetical protein [Bradyrhizobium sp. 23]MCK1317144.1 hypothetical protein [Bradyrhizobium sp. 23]
MTADNRSMAAALRNLLRVHADEKLGRRAKAKALAEAEKRVEMLRPKSSLRRKQKVSR